MFKRYRLKTFSAVSLFVVLFSFTSPISSASAATVPAAPVINSVAQWANGSLMVTFTPGLDGGSPITDYQYSTDNGVTWKSAGITASPLNIFYTSQPGAVTSSHVDAMTGNTVYTYAPTPLVYDGSYQIKMRAVNVIGLGALSTMVNAVTGNPLNVLQVDSFGCTDYIFVGARGSGESFYANTVSGEMGRTLSAAFNRLAQTSRFKDRISYTGVVGYNAPAVSLELSYFLTMTTGNVPFGNKINSLRTKCPNSKFILAGYSQGAFVVHNYLSSAVTDNRSLTDISATLLVGDPAKQGTGIIALGMNPTITSLITNVNNLFNLISPLCAGPLYYTNYTIGCKYFQPLRVYVNNIAVDQTYLYAYYKTELVDPVDVPIYEYDLVTNDFVSYGNSIVTDCLNRINLKAPGVLAGIVDGLEVLADSAVCYNDITKALTAHTNYRKTYFDIEAAQWIIDNAR